MLLDPETTWQHSAKANREDVLRDSRRFSSKTEAVPRWLLEKYKPPESAQVHHTMHRDSTLPLFQGKLANNAVFENKILDSNENDHFVMGKK